MYMPTLARFTSRDPLPENGMPLFGGLSQRKRRFPPDGYRYVRNNPINHADPSGLQEEEEQKKVKCKLRICLNPIGGSLGKLGGHLYLVLERTIDDKAVEWAYRGGPGFDEKRGEGCDCTGTDYGQLIGTHDEYKPGFVDYVPPKDENCKTIAVDAPTCEALHDCLVEVLDRIDNCCIEYTPIPPPLGLGKKCNSNCVVSWLLQMCLAPKNKFLTFVPLPIGKIAPGEFSPVPRCVRESKAERQSGGAENPM